MERIDFRFRLVCDKGFLGWVMNQEILTKRQILRKLMLIKSWSLYHPTTHNVILECDFDDVEFQKIVEAKLKEQESILGVVKPCQEPLFLRNEQDIISKYVRYSIYLSNDKPYNVCIMTDEETEQKYKDNKHMKNITTVIIRSNQDAVDIIEKLYKQTDN